MRRSELLNLTPERIDLEGNLIRVEEAKGKKRREIPMTGRVREIVKELGPTLFSDLPRDKVTHKFTEVARHLMLQGAKLHSLRHTFGTYMIAMGFDVTVVKELLGHEDIKTTLIYAKADKRLLEKAMESLG
jgi:integrase/recombinase XerD